MELGKNAFNRGSKVSEKLFKMYPEFLKILAKAELIEKTDKMVKVGNYIGTKYYSLIYDPSGVVNNGYNNNKNMHKQYVDENGDINIILYESCLITKIVFDANDKKGKNLFETYFAAITVPTEDAFKAFGKAVEEYLK